MRAMPGARHRDRVSERRLRYRAEVRGVLRAVVQDWMRPQMPEFGHAVYGCVEQTRGG